MKRPRVALTLALTSLALASPDAPGPPSSAATPANARAFLERLKEMKGDWIARGADGKDETARFEVIAGGSVVQESTSGFHEGEEMLTLFHLDGDRLLLTHYCMAGNQPRLVATRIAADGTEAEFTFLDGTNLRSRDVGHMDHVVLRLTEDDAMTARWAWFENGREAWMKEIVYERTR